MHVFRKEESLKSPSMHPPVNRGSNAFSYTAGWVYSMVEEISALHIKRKKVLYGLGFFNKSPLALGSSRRFSKP